MEIKFGKVLLASFGDAELSPSKPSSPSGLDFNGQRNVQIDELVRGEHPQFRDRKNRSVALSFSVERLHASYGAAQIFCLVHNDELPVVEKLVITGEKENGGVVRRVCDEAALVAVRSVEQGVRSTTTYSFLIGELKESKV